MTTSDRDTRSTRTPCRHLWQDTESEGKAINDDTERVYRCARCALSIRSKSDPAYWIYVGMDDHACAKFQCTRTGRIVRLSFESLLGRRSVSTTSPNDPKAFSPEYAMECVRIANVCSKYVLPVSSVSSTREWSARRDSVVFHSVQRDVFQTYGQDASQYKDTVFATHVLHPETTVPINSNTDNRKLARSESNLVPLSVQGPSVLDSCESTGPKHCCCVVS